MIDKKKLVEKLEQAQKATKNEGIKKAIADKIKNIDKPITK